MALNTRNCCSAWGCGTDDYIWQSAGQYFPYYTQTLLNNFSIVHFNRMSSLIWRFAWFSNHAVLVCRACCTRWTSSEPSVRGPSGSQSLSDVLLEKNFFLYWEMEVQPASLPSYIPIYVTINLTLPTYQPIYLPTYHYWAELLKS